MRHCFCKGILVVVDYLGKYVWRFLPAWFGVQLPFPYVVSTHVSQFLPPLLQFFHSFWLLGDTSPSVSLVQYSHTSLVDWFSCFYFFSCSQWKEQRRHSRDSLKAALIIKYVDMSIIQLFFRVAILSLVELRNLGIWSRKLYISSSLCIYI